MILCSLGNGCRPAGCLKGDQRIAPGPQCGALRRNGCILGTETATIALFETTETETGSGEWPAGQAADKQMLCVFQPKYMRQMMEDKKIVVGSKQMSHTVAARNTECQLSED